MPEVRYSINAIEIRYFCDKCGEEVEFAGDLGFIGKYVYRCPNLSCDFKITTSEYYPRLENAKRKEI